MTPYRLLERQKCSLCEFDDAVVGPDTHADLKNISYPFLCRDCLKTETRTFAGKVEEDHPVLLQNQGIVFYLEGC